MKSQCHYSPIELRTQDAQICLLFATVIVLPLAAVAAWLGGGWFLIFPSAGQTFLSTHPIWFWALVLCSSCFVTPLGIPLWENRSIRLSIAVAAVWGLFFWRFSSAGIAPLESLILAGVCTLIIPLIPLAMVIYGALMKMGKS